MMKKAALFFLLFALAGSGAYSQFTLKGEFRPRFEYRDGYGIILKESQKPALTVSNRTRLSAYYKMDIVSFGFAIQDIRVWGDDDMFSSTGVTGSKAAIDLNEGWVAIKPYNSGLIKIGRQYLSYEDERIISPRGWNQSEVKYDAVLFQHAKNKLQVDAGLTWNNSGEKNFTDVYPGGKMKSMDFLYIKYKINDWAYLSAIGIATAFMESDTTTGLNWQSTNGLYIGIKKDALSFLASGYYQLGKNRFNGLSSNAYMFSANADYLFAKKFSAGAGIDYMSGNDQSNTDADYQAKSHAFDLLYGIRHRYYGHMDLFSDFPKATANGGLVDAIIRLKYFLTEKTNIGADIHFFSLQNNVIDKSSEMLVYYSKGLGQEVDLNFSWDVNKIFNVKAGYSVFLLSETMEKIQGVHNNSRFPNWAWIMITAKPVFLDTSVK